MNIDLNHATITDAPAFALAIYLLRRRAELNLTIDEAAERAGITADEWRSFERGHVPQQSDIILSLANALETSRVTVSFMACVAEYNQNRECAVPRRAQRNAAGRAPSARATNQHN